MNIKLRERLAGLGLIGWIVAIPITLILLLILAVGFYEGRKAYWDYRVTKMCEKDGGATSRIGGDIPTGIMHPSSFSCRDVDGISLDIEKQIFIISGGMK